MAPGGAAPTPGGGQPEDRASEREPGLAGASGAVGPPYPEGVFINMRGRLFIRVINLETRMTASAAIGAGWLISMGAG